MHSRGLIALAIMLLGPAPAFAHKLYVFAEVQGAMVQGRAYFPGEVPAQNCAVTARDASGRELGHATTDTNGNFTLLPHEHTDHFLLAETPDGHSGQYVVHASELPDNLPAADTTADNAPQGAVKADRDAVHADMTGSETKKPTVSDSRLTELTKQVQELRQQVFHAEERLRFRDILGGIGFILGIAGVAFYMKARR